jgi:hypothetical protein
MRRKEQQRQQEAYEEDEDNGGPRAQCAQQWFGYLLDGKCLLL